MRRDNKEPGLPMNREKCILVAEDNENDLFLLRRAFEAAGLSDAVLHARNGMDALAYLTGKPPFSDRNQNPFPDLVLVDLQMPRLGGLDMLRALQTHALPKPVPIVVLSDSFRTSEMEMAESLGAQEFLMKPTGVAEYREMALGLHERWLGDAPKASASAQV